MFAIFYKLLSRKNFDMYPRETTSDGKFGPSASGLSFNQNMNLNFTGPHRKEEYRGICSICTLNIKEKLGHARERSHVVSVLANVFATCHGHT